MLWHMIRQTGESATSDASCAPDTNLCPPWSHSTSSWHWSAAGKTLSLPCHQSTFSSAAKGHTTASTVAMGKLGVLEVHDTLPGNMGLLNTRELWKALFSVTAFRAVSAAAPGTTVGPTNQICRSALGLAHYKEVFPPELHSVIVNTLNRQEPEAGAQAEQKQSEPDWVYLAGLSSTLWRRCWPAQMRCGWWTRPESLGPKDSCQGRYWI